MQHGGRLIAPALPASARAPTGFLGIPDQVWADDMVVMADLGATQPTERPFGRIVQAPSRLYASRSLIRFISCRE